jgi:hypothetical protein
LHLLWTAPLATLALVANTRCQVEEFFEDCQTYLDMAQDETRSWIGWHHPMTLVGRMHRFVTLVRKRFQREVPELRLDRPVRLREAALEEPELRLTRAIAGGLPPAAERSGQEVACQDLAGQTPAPQIPAVVEVAKHAAERSDSECLSRLISLMIGRGLPIANG